jgi:RNA polymerase sigma factor (TIGR02999 family)
MPVVDPPKPGEITELLNRAADSPDETPMSADRLWELVYPELKRRARALYRREAEGGTLSATAILNEAYVRLATDEPREWRDRSHFYAVSSGIMRNVLIDHARARSAAKRGGGAVRQTLDENVFPSQRADDEGFQAARQALEKLAEKHERAALVVAMRVFGGLTVAEVAQELGVSERTAKADFMIARVRLRELLAP